MRDEEGMRITNGKAGNGDRQKGLGLKNIDFTRTDRNDGFCFVLLDDGA